MLIFSQSCALAVNDLDNGRREQFINGKQVEVKKKKKANRWKDEEMIAQMRKRKTLSERRRCAE